jgi:hypothetical protein
MCSCRPDDFVGSKSSCPTLHRHLTQFDIKCGRNNSHHMALRCHPDSCRPNGTVLTGNERCWARRQSNSTTSTWSLAKNIVVAGSLHGRLFPEIPADLRSSHHHCFISLYWWYQGQGRSGDSRPSYSARLVSHFGDHNLIPTGMSKCCVAVNTPH